jgi:hypothetical protein
MLTDVKHESFAKDDLDKILDKCRASKKKCVVDPKQCNLYAAKDFKVHDGVKSLHWEGLAEAYDHRDSFWFIGFNDFDIFFDYLLTGLVKDGKMSLDFLQKDDFYFINVGGIKVHIPGGSDFHGRRAYEPKIYYPKLRADAEEYVKFFHKKDCYTVYVAQVLSVPNRDWKF